MSVTLNQRRMGRTPVGTRQGGAGQCLWGLAKEGPVLVGTRQGGARCLWELKEWPVLVGTRQGGDCLHTPGVAPRKGKLIYSSSSEGHGSGLADRQHLAGGRGSVKNSQASIFASFPSPMLAQSDGRIGCHYCTATAFGMLATLPAVNKISFKTLLIVSKAYVVIRFLGDFVF